MSWRPDCGQEPSFWTPCVPDSRPIVRTETSHCDDEAAATPTETAASGRPTRSWTLCCLFLGPHIVEDPERVTGQLWAGGHRPEATQARSPRKPPDPRAVALSYAQQRCGHSPVLTPGVPTPRTVPRLAAGPGVPPDGASLSQCWTLSGTEACGLSDPRSKPRGDVARTCHLWARPAVAVHHEATLETNGTAVLAFTLATLASSAGRRASPWQGASDSSQGAGLSQTWPETRMCVVKAGATRGALSSSLDVPSLQENNPQRHHLKDKLPEASLSIRRRIGKGRGPQRPQALASRGSLCSKTPRSAT